MNWIVATYAGEGTVVPEVTLVGEAVADVAELALLHILLDGVEELLLGDLGRKISIPTSSYSVAPHLQGGLLCVYCGVRTSCLALVQRGISTTMLRMVCCSLA